MKLKIIKFDMAGKCEISFVAEGDAERVILSQVIRSIRDGSKASVSGRDISGYPVMLNVDVEPPHVADILAELVKREIDFTPDKSAAQTQPNPFALTDTTRDLVWNVASKDGGRVVERHVIPAGKWVKMPPCDTYPGGSVRVMAGLSIIPCEELEYKPDDSESDSPAPLIVE